MGFEPLDHMIGKLKDMENQTRRLPASYRETLAHWLFERFHHQELTSVSDVWISIAEERHHAYRGGRGIGIDEDEFFTEI